MKGIKNGMRLTKRLFAEKQKEYNKANKDAIKEYKKEWYEANKESILEREKETVTCECGSIITYSCMTRHKKSKKHINLMANK